VANFTDTYASNYLYLPNVFQGALQPQNNALSQQTGVSYRKVATSKPNLELFGGVAVKTELQTFEIWSATLTVGYVPGINDCFTDKDGVNWNAIKVDADMLVTSSGTPTRYFLLGKRAPTT
jgi:hypothetical protein